MARYVDPGSLPGVSSENEAVQLTNSTLLQPKEFGAAYLALAIDNSSYKANNDNVEVAKEFARRYRDTLEQQDVHLNAGDFRELLESVRYQSHHNQNMVNALSELSKAAQVLCEIHDIYERAKREAIEQITDRDQGFNDQETLKKAADQHLSPTEEMSLGMLTTAESAELGEYLLEPDQGEHHGFQENHAEAAL